MLNFDIFKQKSPKQRFLLILGLIMFVFYVILGLAFIFWSALPLNIDRVYKILIGIFLIVYAFIRLLSLGRKD